VVPCGAPPQSRYHTRFHGSRLIGTAGRTEEPRSGVFGTAQIGREAPENPARAIWSVVPAVPVRPSKDAGRGY